MQYNSAFPHSSDSINLVHTGLTKREYFAAIALSGLLNRGEIAYAAAQEAVYAADKLIEALNKPVKE